MKRVVKGMSELLGSGRWAGINMMSCWGKGWCWVGQRDYIIVQKWKNVKQMWVHVRED